MDPEGGAAAHMLQRGCVIAPLQSFSNYRPFAPPSRKLSQLRNAEYRNVVSRAEGGHPLVNNGARLTEFLPIESYSVRMLIYGRHLGFCRQNAILLEGLSKDVLAGT
jgi:hypothetical protein